MSEQKFSIKMEEFEGPFDALLQMIEKKKLHISTISLATIADDYIGWVQKNEFNLRDASVFVWTAATLMLIKSRHLLPQFTITDEESEDVDDLQKRLSIYAIYSKQAEKLQGVFGKKRIFERIYRKQVIIKFRPDPAITQQNLLAQFEEIFQTVQPEVFVPEKKVLKTRTLKEIIDDIASRVKQFARVHFHELVNPEDRKDTAVSFLAVLELFKQGEVDLEQEGDFERITVSNKTA